MRSALCLPQKIKSKTFFSGRPTFVDDGVDSTFFFCRHNEDKLTFVWLKDWRQMRQTVGKDEGDERDNLKSNN